MRNCIDSKLAMSWEHIRVIRSINQLSAKLNILICKEGSTYHGSNGARKMTDCVCTVFLNF